MKCNTELEWFNRKHLMAVLPENFDPLKLKWTIMKIKRNRTFLATFFFFLKKKKFCCFL